MSHEANKELIRRYVATWNSGDVEALAQFWAPEMRHHTRSQSHDLEGVRRIVTDFGEAFPDLHFELQDIVAEGDRVVTRMRATGTHTSDYMGVPASGRTIDCQVMGIARIADDKMVEHWGVTDELAIMQQIGLVPDEYLAAMA
jgi:C-1 hydroxylase